MVAGIILHQEEMGNCAMASSSLSIAPNMELFLKIIGKLLMLVEMAARSTYLPFPT